MGQFGLRNLEREDKAGKGFVDFIFYPEHSGADCVILELKVDSTPEVNVAKAVIGQQQFVVFIH